MCECNTNYMSVTIEMEMNKCVENASYLLHALSSFRTYPRPSQEQRSRARQPLHCMTDDTLHTVFALVLYISCIHWHWSGFYRVAGTLIKREG